MASQILSIDIRDDQLCAALIEQRGGEVLVHACAHAAVDALHGPSLAGGMEAVLDQLEDIPATAVIGLPLSLASLRNLHLPFSERKKIAQILPLELEDQLLAPVDQYILDFTITGQDEEGSSVLVVAVEKAVLAELVESLAGRDCRLKKVFLTAEVLSHACLRVHAGSEAALFLTGDAQAMSMTLWNGRQVVFMRRIPWPEPLFAAEDGAGTCGNIAVAQDRMRQIMARVCTQIRVGLYYVGRNWQEMHQPQKAVLSGCLAELTSLSDLLASELAVTVSSWQPGREISGLALDTSVQQQWNPASTGSCIELALTAQQRRKKQGLLNFLRGEFAPGPEQYYSRGSLRAIGAGVALLAAALIAFLWFGYQRLDSRAADLLARMQAIYQQTFPGGPKKVDRPYLYMQSKMREMEGAEVALPLFSDRKRVLEILADISSRIPDDLALHVSRLVVDSQGVQLKGTTDAFNNVDVIKNRLAASGKYGEVKIVSATADKKKGTVRFEIHLQLGEAS